MVQLHPLQPPPRRRGIRAASNPMTAWWRRSPMRPRRHLRPASTRSSASPSPGWPLGGIHHPSISREVGEIVYRIFTRAFGEARSCGLWPQGHIPVRAKQNAWPRTDRVPTFTPMRVFIVHAHHEPTSFNAAMTATATAALAETGHEVVVSDLYAMGFDPVSDRRNFVTVKDAAYLRQQAEESHAHQHDGFAPEIAAEIEKLFWCDALIFQFPLWWFGLPAILKGWVDRVFALGPVYGGGRRYENGMLAGRRAMCALTTGGPPESYGPAGRNGDIDMLLYPVN